MKISHTHARRTMSFLVIGFGFALLSACHKDEDAMATASPATTSMPADTMPTDTMPPAPSTMTMPTPTTAPGATSNEAPSPSSAGMPPPIDSDGTQDDTAQPNPASPADDGKG